MDWIHSTFQVSKPVIGMVHLPPLPGAPLYGGVMNLVRERALQDAEALIKGGVHGLFIENFGDTPFFPGPVPTVTVAAMSVIAAEIRKMSSIPVGINVLRNDGLSAMSIAMAAELDFIRVNILSGARVTDQGVINGIAHDLLRLRQNLSCKNIKILADVQVKHSSALGETDIRAEAGDTVERGLADGLVVSGQGTGSPTKTNDISFVKEAVPSTAVFVGSGVNENNIKEQLAVADGLIIGSAFKTAGNADNPVDLSKVQSIMNSLL